MSGPRLGDRPQVDKTRRNPLIFAHRGASLALLENTIPAFDRALQEGADGLELDVRLCHSGELVVFHDEDLRRLAGRSARVADLPWSDLQGVRLPSGHSIPRFAEVLEAYGKKTLLNVELKCDGPWFSQGRELIAQAARDIRRADAFASVLVSSFHPFIVWRWARLYPHAGFLFESQPPPLGTWKARPSWLIPWISPASVHPEASLCTPTRVAHWRGRGYTVIPWTVDDPASIRRLVSMGVDGMITNDPAGARRALSLTPGFPVA